MMVHKLKFAEGKKRQCSPETLAEYIFVVEVASSCSVLLNSELTKE